MDLIKQHSIYLFIHSPLAGPLTWSRVAGEMQGRGIQALLPTLTDSPRSRQPFWQQHAASVSQGLADLPGNMPVILVAHSGAGPLLPAIGQSLPNPIHAYVFVDAGIPRDGTSRLHLMELEDPRWAAGFRQDLERGGRFPTWSQEDLQDVIPDEPLRRQTIAELRPRGLGFFTEPIPVFDGWPDAPCIYIWWSPPYAQPAARARQEGWIVRSQPAGHFHMLVEPEAVADTIIEAVNQAG